MKKSDLKDGMLVKYRSGAIRLVLKERVLSDCGYMSFISFDEDLSHFKKELEWDIVEIKGEKTFCSLNLKEEWKEAETIWVRQETKKMTIAEIQEELGYKIEVVE